MVTMYVISDRSNGHSMDDKVCLDGAQGEQKGSISEGRRMSPAYDQPENDTQDVLSQRAQNSSLQENGLIRFLSCFGLFRERNLPNKNFVAVKGSGTSLATEDCNDSSREFHTAATKLLRARVTGQEGPCSQNDYTAIKHIRQLETWDCGRCNKYLSLSSVLFLAFWTPPHLCEACNYFTFRYCVYSNGP